MDTKPNMLPTSACGRLLESHGHQAEHVADIGLRDAADSPIWLHAIENEAILVTKDEDFAHRFRQGGSAPVILWLRIGNTSRRAPPPCVRIVVQAAQL
jgi:predicted nuclease of predicted toxin-antitoxin system